MAAAVLERDDGRRADLYDRALSLLRKEGNPAATLHTIAHDILGRTRDGDRAIARLVLCEFLREAGRRLGGDPRVSKAFREIALMAGKVKPTNEDDARSLRAVVEAANAAAGAASPMPLGEAMRAQPIGPREQELQRLIGAALRRGANTREIATMTRAAAEYEELRTRGLRTPFAAYVTHAVRTAR